METERDRKRDEIRMKFEALSPLIDERATRVWAATEARALSTGGIALVCEATGMSRTTVREGLAEIRGDAVVDPAPVGRVRRPGGGRKSLVATDETLLTHLEELVEPVTRGDPMSPLRWTCKSTRNLSDELKRMGHSISHMTVGQLLRDAGYSLQGTSKAEEGSSHPDRNAQFEHINAEVERAHTAGQPAISVDTKKKELVGNYANGGREWHPKGEPPRVLVHDFIDPKVGKAIPYGVYDLFRNEGWVSVGTDHDTAEFAVESIRRWWRRMGRRAYPNAHELMVTADAGGSNGYRSRLWKVALQRLANDTGLQITVCHFPPGTSKWNKIEHRMFCHITENWRATPLTSHAAVVSLIGSTRTSTGLQIKAALDKKSYPKGIKVSDAELATVELLPAEFHGDWNYTIAPHSANP